MSWRGPAGRNHTPGVRSFTGAFANRVRFKAYLLFLVAWLLLVHFPFAHMVWGGGILQKNGVLDFAGGIVVHSTAGMAALAAVFFVGRRKEQDKGPHSIPLVALGTGLLWFGWYGFNAGSELKVDPVTALAFLNTDVAASFAAITWLVLAWIIEKKPKFVGLLTGFIAGLAAVTPGAGYVSTPTAILIGIVASVVCYYAIWLKNTLDWDDALDVWGVHGVGGVGGVLGVVCLGLFAFASPDTAGAWQTKNDGGFASVRSRPRTLGLQTGDTLVARVRGDGREYQLNLYAAGRMMAFSYRAPVKTRTGEWIDVAVPLDRFEATSFGRVRRGAGPVDPRSVTSVGFLLAEKTPGPFTLEVAWIKVLRNP
jgi:ammonium transporter